MFLFLPLIILCIPFIFIIDVCTINLPFQDYLLALIFNPKENDGEKERRRLIKHGCYCKYAINYIPNFRGQLDLVFFSQLYEQVLINGRKRAYCRLIVLLSTWTSFIVTIQAHLYETNMRANHYTPLNILDCSAEDQLQIGT